MSGKAGSPAATSRPIRSIERGDIMRTFARITGPTTALLFGLAVGPTLLTAQVSASGFGVRVTRSVGGLAPTPSVALAGARNLDGATVDQVSLPGTLQTGLISTISTGAS